MTATDGLWIETTDGQLIRADTITALQVVDGNYKRQRADSTLHAGDLILRAFTGSHDGKATYHHLAGEISQLGDAFTALRLLVRTLGEEAGRPAVIISYDAKVNSWRTQLP
ncbi:MULTISPECIES: hypothetical protein [unclassified Actinoplanes]|uniref:hypothetical protein n=1 Tax=unclassified Actinoplanes TaxID=2626549 RepID=UPI0012BAA7ED|nr:MULTISPECIES: hypothetical protein [unclassified Actinoplanes]